MKIQNTLRRVLCAVVALALTASYVPYSVFAEDANTTETSGQTDTQNTEQQDVQNTTDPTTQQGSDTNEVSPSSYVDDGIQAIADNTYTVYADKDGNLYSDEARTIPLTATIFKSNLDDLYGSDSISGKYATEYKIVGTNWKDISNILSDLEDGKKLYIQKAKWSLTPYYVLTISVIPQVDNTLSVTSTNGSVSINDQSASGDFGYNDEDLNVEITPNSNYYVSSVLLDGTEQTVNYENGNASFTLSNTDAKSYKSMEVKYENIFDDVNSIDAVTRRKGSMSSAAKEKLENEIISKVTTTGYLSNIDKTGISVTYEANNTTIIIGSSKQNLDYEPSLILKAGQHSFGGNDGEGRTETVYVTYPGSEDGKVKETTLEISVPVNVADKEASNIVVNDNALNVTYVSGTTQKEQVYNALDLTNSTPSDITIDQIKVEYKNGLLYTEVNDKNRIPTGEQTIRITYLGNDDYGESTIEKTVVVAKGSVSLKVNSQSIKYGETFGDIITVSENDALPLYIIAGADLSLNPYVSVNIDVTNLTGVSIIDKQIQNIINSIPSGSTLNDILPTLNSILDILEKFGLDVSDVNAITDLIAKLPEGVLNMKVQINELPTDAGAYVVAGVTLSPNYNTSFGVGALAITPDVTSKKLVWNQDISTVKVGEVANTDFTASLVDRAATEIKYVYAGITNEGAYTGSEPVDKIGVYTQTAYVALGGNEWAPALTRTYTVEGLKTSQVSPLWTYKEYAYNAQPVNPYSMFTIKDENGDTFTPEASQISLVYTNKATGKVSLDEPTDVGHYYVAGTYNGDATHNPCAIVGSFKIVQANATVTIDSYTKVEGEADPEFTYTVNGLLGNDTIGEIELTRDAGETYGQYSIYPASTSLNPNYNVTFVNGTLTINPKAVVLNHIPTITADDKTLAVGDTFDPKDGVTAYDEEDKDLTESIEVINNGVDTSKAGEYSVTYKVTDSQGASCTKTITVTVYPKAEVINHIPTISAEDKTLTVGDTFEPLQDVHAYDYEDKNITTSITVINNEVNTSKAGTYSVTYKVTDSQGASCTKTITVTVYPKAEVINHIPTISATDKTLKVGDTFDSKDGVTAYDEEDKDLTDKIEVISNDVDTSKPGTYSVTYKVTDSQGASCTKTITVTVYPKTEVINHIPTISASDKTLKVGDIFDALADVTADDKEDGDVTANIEVIKNEVDITKPGTYEVTYKVTDSQGAASTKTITVTVYPKTEVINHIPTISAEDKTLTVGDTFDPKDGVTAYDEEDKDLTDKIEVINNEVNTSKAGTYEVVYSVTDSQGATGTKTIVVNVNPKAETLNRIPTISAEDKTLTVGDTFDPKAGVSAYDAEDGDVTANIEVIKNEVDTSVAGTYEVTYKVTDSKGAASTKTITVTVYPKMEVINHIPTITAEDKTITVGDTFDIMADVSASDAEDGDLTDKITYTITKLETTKARVAAINNNVSEIDTSVPGVYEITYSVTDSQGATGTKTIVVNVNPKMETLNSVPTISAEDKTLTVGDTFDVMANVSAQDAEDGDLTESIEVINNTVDTSKAGTYEVTYSVTDSQGATTTKTITVTVNEKAIVDDTDADSSNTDSGKKEESKVVDTSDKSNIAMHAAGLAIAGVTLVAVLRKKKEHE